MILTPTRKVINVGAVTRIALSVVEILKDIANC